MDGCPWLGAALKTHPSRKVFENRLLEMIEGMVPSDIHSEEIYMSPLLFVIPRGALSWKLPLILITSLVACLDERRHHAMFEQSTVIVFVVQILFSRHVRIL